MYVTMYIIYMGWDGMAAHGIYMAGSMACDMGYIDGIGHGMGYDTITR
jgi:hypothetical protein